MLLDQRLLFLCFAVVTSVRAWGGNGHNSNDAVLLKDVDVLTLYSGRMTNARRSSPVPQLNCVGGTAGCGSYVPQVVQCYNRGSDGYDAQWECKADLDNAYRFGRVEVSCEGYNSPDDPYVLRGSCGLEYTLDLTKEGHEQRHNTHHTNQHHNQHHSNNYGQEYYQEQARSWWSKQNSSSSWGGELLLLVVVGVLIYGCYRCCISPSQREADADAPPPYDQHRDHPNASPPPYGFKNQGANQGAAPPHTSSNSSGSTGGGFWTGAGLGGLAGYMFGNRGSRTYTGYENYGPNVHHNRGFGSSWFGGGGNRGWFGSSSRPAGRSTYSSSGGGGGFGGSSSGSSGGSTGTRTASGFGGTKRR